MEKFEGFPEGLTSLIRIPELFFSDVVPNINNIDDLRLLLYIFWRIEKTEEPVHYLRKDSVINDPFFYSIYSYLDPLDVPSIVDGAVERLVDFGVILISSIINNDTHLDFLFINSPKGRSAVEAINSGKWIPGTETNHSTEWLIDYTSIFKLFEENIGIITPLIADALSDAESSYPLTWIQEAIQIAAERNKRNWKYIDGILRRWEKDGRSKKQYSEDSEKDRRKYIEGEFADYIEH